ncbi:MAG: hypothetical protein IT556_10110 [Acetobacteraceae bacterium]|nr:hypothetical protein [Acetobacteraceae bacterium]
MTDRTAPAPARPADPPPAGALPATPAPASVTPAELHEAVRRAGLSNLNPGQQADFLKGLQAIAVLAARLPREVSLFLPFGFDFRPDLHAPAPRATPARPAARPRPKPAPKPKPAAKARPKARRR